jgi:hypothetical protein
MVVDSHNAGAEVVCAFTIKTAQHILYYILHLSAKTNGQRGSDVFGSGGSGRRKVERGSLAAT